MVDEWEEQQAETDHNQRWTRGGRDGTARVEKSQGERDVGGKGQIE